MRDGIYEALVTAALGEDLAELPTSAATLSAVPDAEQPHILAHHVAEVVRRRIAAVADPSDRLDIVNRIVAALPAALPQSCGDCAQRPYRQRDAC